MWPFTQPRPPPVLPAWHGPAALVAEHWRVIALAAAIPLLRGALHLTLLEPAARAALRLPASPARLPPSDARRVSKFAECAWKAGAYVTLTALGTTALAGSPWAPAPLGARGTTLASARAFMWHNPASPWPAPVTLPPTAARYWLAQAAFYLSSLVSLFFFEHRRSDFGVMVAHHLTTVSLITGASLARLEVPGIAVAALHDPADIFLEGAKVASYAGLHGLATACFVALTVTWAVTRLGLLPLLAADAWRAGGAGRAGGGHSIPIPAARPLSVLLWALVAMHTYWFALIARIAASQLGSGRVTRDVRESADEEVEVEGQEREKGGGWGGEAGGSSSTRK